MQCRRLVVVTNLLVANHLPVGHWLGWRVTVSYKLKTGQIRIQWQGKCDDFTSWLYWPGQLINVKI